MEQSFQSLASLDGLRPSLRRLRPESESDEKGLPRGARDCAPSLPRGSIFKVALELERIAASDEYFVENNLSPNIDFYSAITLKALGFPTDMFTVVCAVARTAGWIAHWKEMIEDPLQRIGRSRQLYTGATERTYIPIEART